MNPVKDAWIRFHFKTRNQFFSKLKLRAKAPQVDWNLQNSENLFYRLVLQKLEQLQNQKSRPSFEAITTVVDVGCRNWSYLPALSKVFPNATCIGIEVDGGRRLADLHRRKDVAQAFAHTLQKTGQKAQHWVGDFRNFEWHHAGGHKPDPKQTLFTLFYPFVSTDPCAGWGLPSEFAKYDQLLQKVRTLAPGATVLSLHQGQWEADLARAEYESAHYDFAELALEANEFYHLWPSPYRAGLFAAYPR